VALQRLIGSTGSTLDAEGEALYRRLVTDPNHVAGALAMMAGWDLDMLRAALPRLAVPLHQIVGGRDRTVPPADARRVQRGSRRSIRKRAKRALGGIAARLPGRSRGGYEPPIDAEVTIDAASCSPEQGAQLIFTALRARGFLDS